VQCNCSAAASLLPSPAVRYRTCSAADVQRAVCSAVHSRTVQCSLHDCCACMPAQVACQASSCGSCCAAALAVTLLTNPTLVMQRAVMYTPMMVLPTSRLASGLLFSALLWGRCWWALSQPAQSEYRPRCGCCNTPMSLAGSLRGVFRQVLKHLTVIVTVIYQAARSRARLRRSRHRPRIIIHACILDCHAAWWLQAYSAFPASILSEVPSAFAA
jgi:hypothetical protein